MATKSASGTLYTYRFYTAMGPLTLCAETSTGADMWAMIKKSKTLKDEDLRLWIRLPNGTYERFWMDASAIIGLSDVQGNASTQRATQAQQRRERPTATASSAIARRTHPSRVTIGKTASTPSGLKR